MLANRIEQETDLGPHQGVFLMSARLSTRLPLACSGDIYAAVPITAPATVAPRVTVGEFSGSKLAASGVSLNAFANPKSSNFTTPSGVTFTLAGFRSR